MKIQVSQAELLRAAFIAAAPATGATTIPILNNVLIDASAMGVELRAAGFDMRVKVPMNATVITPGMITVPARTLADLSKSLSSGEVVLEDTGKGVTVTCGSSIANLATMPAKDFPAWPMVEAKTTLEIPAAIIRGIVEKVLPSAPIKDVRRILNGVCLQIKPESVIAVATDGKTLSKLDTPLSSGVDEAQIILPWFLLQQAAKLVGDEPVILSTDGTQIVLAVEGVQYISNGIDGKYPNYEAVIPRAFDVEIDFPRKAMLTALKRVMVLGDRQNFQVDLDFAGGVCKLTTEDYDRGRFTDTVGANVGDSFSLCINYKLLEQALSTTEADTITMQANSPTTPIIFTGDDGFMILVMPIKKTERAPEPEAEAVEA